MKVLRFTLLVCIVGLALGAGGAALARGNASGLGLPPVNMEFVGKSDGNAWALDQVGNYAYVISAEGLRVIDVSTPASPTQTGFLPLTSTAWGVVVSGTYAYIAADWNGLVVVNVSNPAAPGQVGSVGTVEGAMWVAVQGNYAYVAAYNAGLRIIDVSNPNQPTEVGSYNTPGSAMGVAVEGNLAFVADYDAGLRIINVANPAAPVEIGFIRGPLDPADPDAWTAQGVAVAGDWAYVVDWDKVRIIWVADPSRPVQAAVYDTPGQAYAITLAGSYAYVADYDLGVSVIDVSSPVFPHLAGFYDSDGTATGLTVPGDSFGGPAASRNGNGQLVYVADGDGALLILRFLGETPATATPTPSQTPTATPTPTATTPASPTATVTASPTATFTSSPAVTATATSTATAGPTETFTATPTGTLPATPTPTATATDTVTATPTATETAVPTATPTATSEATPTETATATATEEPTSTPTATLTATATPTFTVTRTATPAATRTPTPTSWPTRTPTATAWPSPVRPSTEWVNFHGRVQLADGRPAPYGAVVDAYDSRDVHCGTYYITRPGVYGLMPVYRDDESTPERDGALPGDIIRFFVNGMPAATLGPDDAIWTSHSDLQNVNLRVGNVIHRTLFLQRGWNLISLDISPLNPAVASIFSQLRGLFSMVLSFDCAEGALSYYPDLPAELNTLRIMDMRHGYWVRMLEEAHLVVAGIEAPSNTPIRMCSGYNLVGYLPNSALPVRDALFSLEGNINVVLGFDPLLGAQSYYPDLPPGLNSLQEMRPGRGFWVRLNAPGELIYP